MMPNCRISHGEPWRSFVDPDYSIDPATDTDAARWHRVCNHSGRNALLGYLVEILLR